jgi:hypothetical protein
VAILLFKLQKKNAELEEMKEREQHLPVQPSLQDLGSWYGGTSSLKHSSPSTGGAPYSLPYTMPVQGPGENSVTSELPLTIPVHELPGTANKDQANQDSP